MYSGSLFFNESFWQAQFQFPLQTTLLRHGAFHGLHFFVGTKRIETTRYIAHVM